ncbi:hypothetical protein D9M68_788160 [compost metagenome]
MAFQFGKLFGERICRPLGMQLGKAGGDKLGFLAAQAAAQVVGQQALQPLGSGQAARQLHAMAGGQMAACLGQGHAHFAGIDAQQLRLDDLPRLRGAQASGQCFADCQAGGGVTRGACVFANVQPGGG